MTASDLPRRERNSWREHPWHGLKAQAKDLLRFAGIYWRLMRMVTDKSLRSEYRRRIAGLLRSRRDPAVLFAYAVKCAMHYHHYRMATEMSRGRRRSSTRSKRASRDPRSLDASPASFRSRCRLSSSRPASRVSGSSSSRSARPATPPGGPTLNGPVGGTPRVFFL